MITCPNCGASNQRTDRFCHNCGASIVGLVPDDRTPVTSEWRMSDPGPLPEPPPRRRTWLWISLGLVGVCLLICCLAVVWASTIGQDDIERFATRIAREATEAANE